MDIPVHSSDQPTENTFAQAPGATVAYHIESSRACACPICGKRGLLRIRRRFIDRVLSLFVRQRRFRCTHSGCHWEGNLTFIAGDAASPHHES